MTKVTVYKKEAITEVLIEGHSGYQCEGSDIVCASISSISITTVNACLRVNESSVTYQKKDGFLDIKVNISDPIIDILIDNMVNLLKELEEDYKKYIKINEEVYL